MERTDGEEPPSGSQLTIGVVISNGNRRLHVDESLVDDGRSSSLSEIDDVSEQEPSDEDELQKPDRTAEVDSEAETERAEDSPKKVRPRREIVLTGSRFETSLSKLAQSTTYDEIDGEEEVQDTPSKTRRSSRNHGRADDIEGGPPSHGRDRFPPPRELAGKKRKRHQSGDETGTEPGEDEPRRKRRGSARSDRGGEDGAGVPPLSPELADDPSKHVEAFHGETPADDAGDRDETTIAPTRGKKGKRGKRKGKKIKDLDEGTDTGVGDAGAEGVGDDVLPEDEDAGDGADEGDDAEVVAKSEEELVKKMAAMESLSILEKEFSTLRDKIYDERIAKLNQELEQLSSSEPTHPELLRQLDTVKSYCDAKVQYEQTLFHYRLQSLLNKSLAERAQVLGSYYQQVRDIRERHSAVVSRQFYAIQRDRFKTENISPAHYIPFPTRRSQQVAQQTAYNQEVSIMAGIAKYVGFPAAPALAAARPSEIEEDLGKMGISMELKSASSGLPRAAAMPSMTPVEDGFQEPATWAQPPPPSVPPSHAAPRQQARVSEHSSRAPASSSSSSASPASFTTPAGQKRIPDGQAPNGSAHAVVEHPSAPNSLTSAPSGIEPDRLHHVLRLATAAASVAAAGAGYDGVDGKNGVLSQSTSPPDIRKGPPHLRRLDNQPPLSADVRVDAGPRSIGHAAPSRLGGLFASAKVQGSPPMPAKPGPVMHASGIAANAGPSRMTAR